MPVLQPLPAPRPWRVLVVHNRYRDAGGEDAVVDAEVQLLRQHGHHVERYERHNDELDQAGGLALMARSFWNTRTRHEVAQLARRQGVHLVHLHNSFPIISPSVYAAAHDAGVPLVQTLHNFRLVCPQAMLLHRGRPCTDCVGHVPWRAVVRRCCRGSALHSAGVATLVQLHRSLGSWQHGPTLNLALNQHCADLLARGGLPAERLRIKPNFVDLPADLSTDMASTTGPRQGLLFVGRLSAEKGTALLAAAGAALPSGAPPIRVVGDGPERAHLQGRPALQLLGALPPLQVWQAMQRATALLLPSLAAESFPRVLVEAFACGLPVLASRVGALPELVQHGRTGWLFDAADTRALAGLLHRVHTEPHTLARMGEQAQAHHQAHWTGEHNLAQLLAVYAEACALHAARQASAGVAAHVP